MNSKFRLYFIFGFILLNGLFALSFSYVVKVDAVSPTVFYRNLAYGYSGEDVRDLQKFLNSDPETIVSTVGAGSAGSETTYFGNATRLAVVRFQNKYKESVLFPLGLTSGTGFVGNLTRQKINILLSTNIDVAPSVLPEPHITPSTLPQPKVTPVVSSSNVPIITSLSSTIIQNGEEVTIYGKNFTKSNTVFLTPLELPDKYINIVSEDGTFIVIKISTPISDFLRDTHKDDQKIHKAIIDQIKSVKSEGTDGWYLPANIRVVNENGESESVTVSINILNGV